MKDKKFFPRVRFSEFSDEWVVVYLGNLIKLFSDKSTKLNQYPVLTSSRTGLTLQKDYFKDGNRLSDRANVGFNIIPKGFITYRSRSDDGKFVFNQNYLATTGLVSVYYPVFEAVNKQNYFLLCLLNRDWRTYYKHSVGTSQKVLAYSDLKFIKVIVPGAPEQQKISDFLTKVDTWLTNLKSQKKELENYKKGLTQKIFSKQMRFKDEGAKVYTDWMQIRIDDLGDTYNGLSGKTGDDFGSGENYITYKQIFDASEIDTNKFMKVVVEDNEKQNRAKFGDIFFTTSSETPNEVGFSSVLLTNAVSPYLNSFAFGFRPINFNQLNPYFAKHFFRSSIFRRLVVKLAQGSTRYNISKTEFTKLIVEIPQAAEQAKIAYFLTSVDKVIDSKQNQIQQAEIWKKGLLRQLFV